MTALARGSVLVAVGGTIALGVGPGSAEAFVRTKTEAGLDMKWGRKCITVLVYADNPPPELDRDTIAAAAQAAAAAWSQSKVGCTELQLGVNIVSGDTADASFDEQNRIAFRRDAWRKVPCDQQREACGYDPAALAITSVFARTKDGRILDADMEINAVNFRWADVPVQGRRGHQDLQNVLTHEFGHLIGLDHTPVMEATMFASATPGDTSKRDLSMDDLNAVCSVYPASGGLPCADPDDEGGCRVARGDLGGEASGRRLGGLGWLAAAIGVLGWARARRRGLGSK